MECERMKDMLEPYAGGSLAPAEAALVEAHTQNCPACARQLRWISAMKTSLRALPRPAIPEDFRAQLMKQARSQCRGWRDYLEGWRTSWKMATGLGFASAFAAAAAVLVFTHFSSGGEEIFLDEVLAAHTRYSLTMPAANRDALFAGLAGEARHD